MRTMVSLLLGAAVLAAAPSAQAQFATVGSDQVRGAVTAKGKTLVVDVRSPEEYQAGHIPGAVNIPAERITAEKGRLPKDRSAAIIFYCRGTG